MDGDGDGDGGWGGNRWFDGEVVVSLSVSRHQVGESGLPREGGGCCGRGCVKVGPDRHQM